MAASFLCHFVRRLRQLSTICTHIACAAYSVYTLYAACPIHIVTHSITTRLMRDPINPNNYVALYMVLVKLHTWVADLSVYMYTIQPNQLANICSRTLNCFALVSVY